jgi:hypothetical protein
MIVFCPKVVFALVTDLIKNVSAAFNKTSFVTHKSWVNKGQVSSIRMNSEKYLSSGLFGTIHLRRRQFFTLFWPLPPYRRQFFSTIRRQIWQIFDPSPLEHADVLNGWSPTRSNNPLHEFGKVEKVLKGSLVLISFTFSESSKYGWKVCLRSKGKVLKTKSLLTSPSNVLPQLNFPANNSSFHWTWWDLIQAIFLNLFYFMRQIKFILTKCLSLIRL